MNKNQLFRLSIHPIEETMEAIQNFCAKVKKLPIIEARKEITKRTEFANQLIKLGSIRLQTFMQSGIVCVSCEAKATHFAMERHHHDEVFHMNLYGVKKDGSELLFTHDHILARSLGGADNISNTQTMCTDCNSFKSIEELKILKSRQAKAAKKEEALKLSEKQEQAA